MKCSCCGQSDRALAVLPSRDDIHLCRDCLEWMHGQVGIDSTPTLPVVELTEAVSFYERAGFGVRVYVEDEHEPGEGFAFVDFDGQSVFDLDVTEIDPGRNGAGCFLIVQDPDAWHARMTTDGLPVTPIADQPWGMREFTLTDPFGNKVRIGRGLG
jgi:uncharacterized glyoxalase superfamily protein PhnB